MGRQAHVHADTYLKSVSFLMMKVNFELIHEDSPNFKIFGF